MQKIIISLILSFLFLNVAFSQAGKDSALFLELAKLDSLLFEESFNKCKISHLETLVSEDLEFYHDQGGLTNSKEVFIKTIQQNICGNSSAKPIRKLVKNSLQVYPLYENGVLYAAIQSGEHEFYLDEPNKARYLTSTAKFTHLWTKEKTGWSLKRVLSYDHQTPTNH